MSSSNYRGCFWVRALGSEEAMKPWSRTLASAFEANPGVDSVVLVDACRAAGLGD